MGRRVYLRTRDLLFRAKLNDLIVAAGGVVTRDLGAGADLAVIELESDGWERQLAELAGRGVPTLAFGAHVDAGGLRRAREIGAEAVPNSQVERRLGELLRS